MYLCTTTSPFPMSCSLCPRHCAVNRCLSVGFCQATESPEAATICRHTGEEPPLVGQRGICNLFFAHCNLQCIYCQNHDISHSNIDSKLIRYRSVTSIVARIAEVLSTTEQILGFVSPSHYAQHIPAIVEELHRQGLHPTIVYNTGGYDTVATLRMLEPYIDIYLPDYKYNDSRLAAQLSQAADYPQRAAEALTEMYRQKGSALHIDENGLAFGGIIIRHLILPGAVDNSLRCLDWIADNLSTRLHISLMAQYFPTANLLQSTTLPIDSPLRRTLTETEYTTVVDHFHALGFYNGWIQELTAATEYHPDFTHKDAF